MRACCANDNFAVSAEPLGPLPCLPARLSFVAWEETILAAEELKVQHAGKVHTLTTSRKRSDNSALDAAMAPFHPAVRDWFASVFHTPTRAQEMGWPAIARGDWTLIFAPTGSGKTLTAFLWALDRLMFAPRPPKERRCRVVYISPLKALAVDGERNLRAARAIRAALDRHSQRRHAPGGGGALPPRPRRHPDHHAGVDLPDADLERA